MKKQFIFISVLLFFYLIIGNKQAFACKCVGQSMNESFQASDAVFKGKVIDISKGDFSKNNEKVTFEVNEAWKGVNQSQIQLKMELTSCSIDFEKGKEYIVFAYDYDGDLETNTCTPTKETRDSSAELIHLGKGKTEFEEVNIQKQSITKIIIMAAALIVIVSIILYRKKK